MLSLLLVIGVWVLVALLLAGLLRAATRAEHQLDELVGRRNAPGEAGPDPAAEPPPAPRRVVVAVCEQCQAELRSLRPAMFWCSRTCPVCEGRMDTGRTDRVVVRRLPEQPH
jgi:hypothetical protein